MKRNQLREIFHIEILKNSQPSLLLELIVIFGVRKRHNKYLISNETTRHSHRKLTGLLQSHAFQPSYFVTTRERQGLLSITIASN